MILFRLQLHDWPWWITPLGTAIGLGIGIATSLAWRCIAVARKESLEDERAANLEKDKTIVRLEAELKVSQAKTDLNGLRGEFAKEMQEMKGEFTKHADQDLAATNQQIEATRQQTAALAAVEASLKLLQERH